MNRVDFMNQLESLLQGIPSTEREEAIQYYNDYFDDAGKENEQEVIEALGNPARVAENIKRDLPGNGCADAAQKVRASDRVLMEYGKNSQDNQEEPDRKNGDVSGKAVQEEKADFRKNRPEYENTAGYGNSGGNGGENRSPFEDYGRDTQDHYEESCSPEKKSEGMPVWAVAMLVTVLIFAAPVLGGLALGILGVVFGLLASWFAMILGFGIAAAGCLIAMVILAIIGFACLFSSPWAGMALIGGGLICGCVGILFLMLTVFMAGVITPSICRAIAFVFRMPGRKRRAKTA